MAFNIPPAPLRDQDINSAQWRRWFQKLSDYLTGARPLGAFSSGRLPAARENEGALVFVPDGFQGSLLAYSDGISWLFVEGGDGEGTAPTNHRFLTGLSFDDSGHRGFARETGSTGFRFSVAPATEPFHAVRLDQLTDEVERLEGLIQDLSDFVDSEIDRLDGDIASVNIRVDDLESLLASEVIRLDGRIDDVVFDLSQLEAFTTDEFLRIDGELSDVNLRVDGVEATLATEVLRIDGEISSLDSRVTDIEDELGQGFINVYELQDYGEVLITAPFSSEILPDFEADMARENRMFDRGEVA